MLHVVFRLEAVDFGREVELHERILRTPTRDEWCELRLGSAACVGPVLDFVDAPRHPHNVARGSLVEGFGAEDIEEVVRTGAVADAADR